MNCSIKTIGGNTFLVETRGQCLGESSLQKTYIIYKDDKRYEIVFPNLTGAGTDPQSYDSKISPALKDAYEAIVKSFSIDV